VGERERERERGDGDAATKRREAAPRQLTVARSSRAIAGERRLREREREIIQLASDAFGGGEIPRASPTTAPTLLISLPCAASRHRHPLPRVSLAYALSLAPRVYG